MAYLAKKMDKSAMRACHPTEIIKGVGLNTDKSPIMQETRGRILKNHALMYIIKGAGCFEDAGTARRNVTSGSLFYLYPQKWHNFDPAPGTTWTEYWVLFDGIKATEAFGDIIPPPQKPFHQIGIDPEYISLYETLYDVWFYQGQGYPEYAFMLLHEMLTKVWLQINNFAFRRKNDWLCRVKAFLEQNLCRPECDLQKFAAGDNIGHEALRKRIKRMTGFSPKQYFLMLKINRARELLLRPDERIKDIAGNLGFDDPYYFSRFFHKRTGVSPKEYRRRHLLQS